MKKLVFHTTLFILPVLLLVTFLPVDRRLQFQELKKDCYNHAIWIYDRIHNNHKPADIVFLGSSSTINGIDDRLIEQHLINHPMHVVNLGYCRLGRNLAYTLLKEVTRSKQVKYVVLEVRRGEDQYSHPVFPQMAMTSDVLTANLLFNKDMISDIFNHLAYKVELTQDMLFKRVSPSPVNEGAFGHSTFSDTADLNKLIAVKENRLYAGIQTSGIERFFKLRYPEVYLRKINKLCRENGIKIIYLYIPVYGVDAQGPVELPMYLNYGDVLLPPAEIFQDSGNWYDEDHLNAAGSGKLSVWIAEEIQARLTE